MHQQPVCLAFKNRDKGKRLTIATRDVRGRWFTKWGRREQGRVIPLCFNAIALDKYMVLLSLRGKLVCLWRIGNRFTIATAPGVERAVQALLCPYVLS